MLVLETVVLDDHKSDPWISFIPHSVRLTDQINEQLLSGEEDNGEPPYEDELSEHV